MYLTLTAVGSFGITIAMGWLVVALVLVFIPSRRGRAGWHAGMASIALLVSVAAVSFAGTQIYRDFGFESMADMLRAFGTSGIEPAENQP